MTAALDRLSRARAALIKGLPHDALAQVESFMTALQAGKVSAADRPRIERQLADLRTLAEAALSGAQSAHRQIEEIIAAARSLRTYDSDGRGHTATVMTEAPRRF